MARSEPKGDSSRRIGRWLTGAPAAAALLGAFWVLAVTSTLRKCTTSDELVHLTGGYCYWIHNDYRINPENGNLPGRWAALPLLLGGYRFPRLDQPAWWNSDQWRIGCQFFYELGNDPDRMLLLGRAMIALLGAALGVVVWLWSRRLFGPVGGLISLALYAFSPTLLAHGRLITSDLASALFFALSLAALWKLLHTLTPWTLLASCLAMGGLFVAKMSAVLVVPMALMLMAVRLLSSRPLALGWGKRPPRRIQSRRWRAAAFAGIIPAHALVVGVVIWSFYGFRYSSFHAARPGGEQSLAGGGWSAVLADTGSIGGAAAFGRRHRLLPEAYLYGFAHAYKYSHFRRAFLNGRYSDRGWWYFFPYCFLVKTPLGIFVVLLLAAAAARRQWLLAGQGKAASPWAAFGQGLYRTAPLWILMAVYWAFSIRSHLNIGHRHILPTYAPMFVLAGAAAYWLQMRRRLASVLLALAGLSLVAESLLIWPHYLAYFNPLAGGPKNAYRHLVDSSLDWGQDLPGLKHWLDRRGLMGRDRTPLYLSYFGNGSPDYYGIQAERLPGFPDRERNSLLVPLRGGVYCISATMLQTLLVRPAGPWTREHERVYQSLLARYDQLIRRSESSPGWAGVPFEEDAEEGIQLLDALRFCRLCAWLRLREPADRVGYSILIYQLTDEDIRRALFGPPAELRADISSPP